MEPPKSTRLELGAAPEGYRSGFVSIIGRPNVGKSTLLNQILRTKVAITSSRPQTTRNAIRGILTTETAQFVFVDTPGLHKPHSALGKRLNHVVRSTMTDVDVVLFVVDVAEGVGGGDEFVAAELRRLNVQVVVAANKIDLVDEQPLKQQIDHTLSVTEPWPVHPVSARTGDGVTEILRALNQRLPTGPLYYPPDAVTDQAEQQMVAELVREKALELTREEVPHSIAVVVNEMETDPGRALVRIDATIYVERDSQKGILIGKRGAMLKEIGSRARPEIEAVLGSQVFLGLHVKLERDWQRRPTLLDRFGYGS